MFAVFIDIDGNFCAKLNLYRPAFSLGACPHVALRLKSSKRLDTGPQLTGDSNQARARRSYKLKARALRSEAPAYTLAAWK